MAGKEDHIMLNQLKTEANMTLTENYAAALNGKHFFHKVGRHFFQQLGTQFFHKLGREFFQRVGRDFFPEVGRHFFLFVHILFGR